jgi:tetratricopeptide (TPR) repeat protein
MSLDEHARAGIKALEEKRYNDAVAAFEKAIALAPDRPDMNNALGMAYLHRGDAGNAVPWLEKAVALAEPYTAPEHQAMKLDFSMALATTFQLLDRTVEAKATLERIAATWPDQPNPKLQLGQLLVATGNIDEGVKVMREVRGKLDQEARMAIDALTGAIEAFLKTDEPATVFLEAHRDSYVEYFDGIAEVQVEQGWLAEAARMNPQADGSLKPVIPKGARPYAMSRVDLVDPKKGEVSSVYSDTEPMIVQVEGLEPLAGANVLLPWKGWPFEVQVSTRCPWHWLPITIQAVMPAPDFAKLVDDLIGEWYLAGYNGDFGTKDAGRFHYISDPEPLGDRAVSYTVDLGRASFESIQTLLKRLSVLHDRKPIQRVMFGLGRLAD